MTNPTSNYGFVLPTATDLVTDLPADFDVALQGVDTRLKALQPGTTLGDLAYSSATANTNTRLGIGTAGQVLAVSGGGVPAWTTTADVTPLTTKGDLFTFTTVDARLGVGANNTVLTADSSEATGLKWAAPSAGGDNWTLLNSGGTALTGATTVTVSGISGKDKIMILVQAASSASSNIDINWRLNGDTASNYYRYGIELASPTTYSSSSLDSYGGSTDRVRLGTMGTNAAAAVSGYVLLTGCNNSGVKVFQSAGAGTPGGGDSQKMYHFGGYYNSATVISSISIVSNSGNLDAGTVFVYVA